METTDPPKVESAQTGGETKPPGIERPVVEALHQAVAMDNSADHSSRHRHQAGFYWYLLAVLAVAALLIVYVALGPGVLGIPATYSQTTTHLAAATLLTAVILAAQKLANITIDKWTLGDNVTFFNLRLVLRLVATVLVCLVFLSAISQTGYTVPVVLGMFTVIMGFAVQQPMTSFIGWIYILARRPFRVGDRIKVANATGDVIDVSYFDTTLWEFGGQYLSADHPSGRVIKLPNSTVLNTAVFNYSWTLFPYIWDKIRLYVAYNCDLDFVLGVMRAVAVDEVGETMTERVRAYRSVLDKTPVDQLDVKEEPTVFVRVNTDGWLDAVVRYLVDPKEAGRIKTTLLRKMLVKLNAEPDRTLFPKWR